MATTAMPTRLAARSARLAAAVVEGFRRHDLMTCASAISFQLLTAIVPFLLFAVALAGYLGLEELYERDLLPVLEDSLSPSAMALVDDTVRKVLSSHNLWWLTFGALLAVHQLGGAIRAAMGALERIHGRERDQRPFLQRLAVSTAVAVAVGVLLLGALAMVRFGPALLGSPGGALGVVTEASSWLVAFGLLIVAVGVVTHHGPARDRPLHRVTLGAVLSTTAWVGGSALFGLYLRTIASYETVFGHLATVVILLGWLYLSAAAFLAGAVVDAHVSRQS